jgi:hypothetical protein
MIAHSLTNAKRFPQPGESESKRTPVSNHDLRTLSRKLKRCFARYASSYAQPRKTGYRHLCQILLHRLRWESSLLRIPDPSSAHFLNELEAQHREIENKLRG